MPKFTSMFSIAGSLYIIIHVARSKKRRRRVYTRLMLGMSAMDLIWSIKSFLSTWIIPADSPGATWGAIGTTQTCTAAAFWGQGGSLASIIYNGTLALYFYWTIRLGWKQEMIRKYEVYLHAVPLLIGWSTAIAGLPLLLYNSIGWTCWIGPYPLTCTLIPNQICTRGVNARIYQWAFFHAILWLCFAFVIVIMVLIYQKIRSLERVMDRYRYGSRGEMEPGNTSDGDLRPPDSSLYRRRVRRSDTDNANIKTKTRARLSRQFAGQAWYYILAFFITCPSTLFHLRR